MSAFGPERLAMLVQPDRVHRSVYADPAIFDLEMERVFGRAWLVLGHESQVKNGRVRPTEAPGTGMRFDERALARFSV